MTQKIFFGVVGTRTAHPGHIGAYCTIFNFSAKPNTFFKQIKFQTVDRHNAGQPIAHATTHGARTTARHRVKECAPARSRSLARPPQPPTHPKKTAPFVLPCWTVVTVVNSSKKTIYLSSLL